MLSKERYLETHARFYDLFRSGNNGHSRYLNYEKYQDAELSHLSFMWIAAEEDRKSNLIDILNATNQFCTTNGRLEAWAQVLEETTDTQNLIDVLYECVFPVIRMASDFPMR